MIRRVYQIVEKLMETVKTGILAGLDSGIEQQNPNFLASQSYFNYLQGRGAFRPPPSQADLLLI